MLKTNLFPAVYASVSLLLFILPSYYPIRFYTDFTQYLLIVYQYALYFNNHLYLSLIY